MLQKQRVKSHAGRCRTLPDAAGEAELLVSDGTSI
jgi:hypothetical protein